MSFVTKRERVFDEYEQFELPARNEGKLKAYGSCTDARAWSHFCSDKTENLVDVIKRNNAICTPKYIPTKVIVETLMAARNAEVCRLKRRIQQLQLMLASYDQLDLTQAQKSEIAKAHEEIKAANKDLDELHFDLNLSGCHECIDSEAYETGKSRTAESEMSRGDDWSFDKESEKRYESRACQKETCTATVGTNAVDPRINEMEQTIVCKDAKLSAMKNTLAVMENDVCEPYCVYAHIYIALERILRILCQHEKYKEYIDLLTNGKETRCLDIKEKIIFKIKVLQRFSLALVSPCTAEFNEETNKTCSCSRNDNVRVEMAYALTAPETTPVSSTMENKRAQLVADIMENEEMKEILIKTSTESIYKDSENNTKPHDVPVPCCIDSENLARLKQLQVDYEDLIQCYENLKHERICLLLRCARYNELEFELENLKLQFKEYNGLWNEKEYYKNRSDETDQLKEKYYVLYDETKNLEMQLQAECEKNQMKTRTITELRNENIALEKKLNDTSIAFEKETSGLQCKLKESECKVMCLEEQIKCLTVQIDNILEQEREKPTNILHDPITLQNEIKQLKEQCKLENYEKETLQEQFHDQLNLINELKNEIEDWKGSYEKIMCRNEYLETDSDIMQEKINDLIERNRNLSDDLDEKILAADNLRNIITNKSLEINKLITENEARRAENKDLLVKLQEALITHSNSIVALEREKTESEHSLHTAKQESQDLLNKLRKYDDLQKINNDLNTTLKKQEEALTELKNLLSKSNAENKQLQEDIQQICELRKQVEELKDNLTTTAAENARLYKICNKEEVEKKANLYEELQNRLETIIKENKHLSDDNRRLRESIETIKEKHVSKIMELETEAKEYRDILETTKNEMKRFSKDNNSLICENNNLNTSLEAQKRETNMLESKLSQFDTLSKDYEILKMCHENNAQTENEQLVQQHKQIEALKIELESMKQSYQNLEKERSSLENELERLKKTCSEKTDRLDEIQAIADSNTNESTVLKNNLEKAQQRIKALINENNTLVENLNAVNQEIEKQVAVTEKTKQELIIAKQANEKMKEQNNRLQLDIDSHLQALNCAAKEADELRRHSHELLDDNKLLENSLIASRDQLIRLETSENHQYSSVYKELEDLKNERLLGNKKINGLMDELEQSNIVISNFKDDILARDDTIAIQQNHINKLEIQVTELLNNLGQLVQTSEDLQDNNRQKADITAKKIEAHHSKATHNMKMELENLKHNQILLENKLTHTSRVSEESLKDQQKIAIKVETLLNEREIIATELKELELKCTGRSLLSPNSCQIDNVISSINNVRNAFDKTISSVQSSSKLLQSKTDEAKKIFEVEKQKIYYEKEEAIRNRLVLENKMTDLKNSLEKEIAERKAMLEDKEAELLNQKLIIEQITKSSESHVKQLKEQLQSLRELYDNATVNITSLKDQIQNISEENNKNLNKLNEVSKALNDKSYEVTTLQSELAKIKTKSKSIIHITTEISKPVTDISTQTDINKENDHEKPIKLYPEMPIIPMSSLDKKNILHLKAPSSENEVKILTAKLNSDMEKKYQRLSPGEMEQHSLPSRENPSGLDSRHDASENYVSEPFTSNNNFKEINVKRNLTDSSVVYDVQSPYLISNDVKNKYSLNTNKSVGEIVNDNDLTHNVATVISNKNNLLGSTSTSNDENMFQFRKDSDTSFKSNTSSNAESNINNGSKNNNLIVKAVTIHESRNNNTEKAFKLGKEDNDVNYNYYNKKEKYIKMSDPQLKKSLPHGTVDDISASLPDNLDYDKTSKNQSMKLLFSHQESPVDKKHLMSVNPSYHLDELSEKQKIKKQTDISRKNDSAQDNLGLQFILDTFKDANNSEHSVRDKLMTKSKSIENLFSNSISSHIGKHISSQNSIGNTKVAAEEKGVMVKIDTECKDELKRLSKAFDDYKITSMSNIESLKSQYDDHIKRIINKHNEGVKNMQGLHEETLHDILNVHENEVENLRSMSIEAMKKTDMVIKENESLKQQLGNNSTTSFEKEPVNIETTSRRKCVSLDRSKLQALDARSARHGPCTCSLDENVTDTIQTIFEHVKSELIEKTYIKNLGNKLINGNIESLTLQELSFLHFKVCRTWKSKYTEEEALQKRIDMLRKEVMSKQRLAHEHIAELDRKVAEEKRLLQERREAMCAQAQRSMACPIPTSAAPLAATNPTMDRDVGCNCPMAAGLSGAYVIKERLSAGDLLNMTGHKRRPKRVKMDAPKVTPGRAAEERREKRNYNDELPTRLRSTHDRSRPRTSKK